MIKKLHHILDQLEDSDNNQQELAFEALEIIKSILATDPFNIEMLLLRIRINANIFENSTEIIKDATFIIENDEFKRDKMVGYDWLFWLYKDILGMPEEAMKIMDDQLVVVQVLFDKAYEKHEKESALLDIYAKLKFDNKAVDEALNLWYKAYKKYPYFDNNAYVGMLFLDNNDLDKAEELLLSHYSWSYQYEDGFRLQYGIKLKKMYDEGKLDNHPTLIGLLFNIIRNENDHFDITGTLDFFEQYYPDLEKLVVKFPENVMILTAIAHTHFFDTKNHEKAYQTFVKMVGIEGGLEHTELERVYKASKKTKNNILQLPFKFAGKSVDMYNNMTFFNELLNETEGEEDKKKIAEIAVNYGEVGYKEYRRYIIEGKGSTENNQPHLFAMLCNNYANAIGEYAELYCDNEDKEKLYNNAAKIHLEGYEVSPFIENLKNAASDYYNGKSYLETIKYALEVLKTYKDIEVSVTHNVYWLIIRSSIALNDIDTAEKYYFIAKELYTKVGGNDNEDNNRFIFSAKLFLEYCIDQKKEYQKYKSELEWFLEEEVAVEEEPNEHGLISYYLGICHKENGDTEWAKASFQITVDFLQEIDTGFYYDICDNAEDCIDDLGGEVIRTDNSADEKKSVFKRVLNIILLPFTILVIIGGFIYASTKDNNKEK